MLNEKQPKNRRQTMQISNAIKSEGNIGNDLTFFIVSTVCRNCRANFPLNGMKTKLSKMVLSTMNVNTLHSGITNIQK